MIPILYDAKEAAFSSNGIGRLAEAIRCTVTEELNGRFELEAEIPITAKHYAEIQDRTIIAATHDETKTRQPFRVYRSSKPINGVVTFGARHISYQLADVVLTPFSGASVAQSLSRFPTYSMPQTDFTFWTDKTNSGTFKITEPTNCRAALGGSQGSILDVYGGEFAWDKFEVKLYASRGADRGVTIRYRKNLLDIRDETDSGASYNAVMPYWTDGETVIMLPEGMLYAPTIPGYSEPWTQETAVNITDQNGNNLEFGIAAVKAQPLDLSDAFDEAPTATQLREEANRRFNAEQVWKPKRNIKVNFVALQNTEEYKNYEALQRVALGDYVTVIYPELGTDVKLKVVKTVYNVLMDRYDEIELGELRATYGQQVLQQAEDRITKLPTKGFLDAAIKHATELITGGLGGHVVFTLNADGEPEEILIMDTDNIATAVNVWRFNQGGLGHSHSGYNGPYDDVALTMDGRINASMITTGIINANLIRSGSINADLITSGTINADLIRSGSINADLITSGNINASLITTGALNASLITTGTLNAARIKAGTIKDTQDKVSWNLTTGEFIGQLTMSSPYAGIAGSSAGYIRAAAGDINRFKYYVGNGGRTPNGFMQDKGFSIYMDQPLNGGNTLKKAIMHSFAPVIYTDDPITWVYLNMHEDIYINARGSGLDSLYTRNIVLDRNSGLDSDSYSNSATYTEQFKYVETDGAGTTIRPTFCGMVQKAATIAATFKYSAAGIVFIAPTGSREEGLKIYATAASPGSGVPIIDLYGKGSTRMRFYSGAVMNVRSNEATINGHVVAYESSSSRRYKENIKPITEEQLDPHRLYDLQPKQFNYHEGMILQYDDMQGQTIPGFIAEEIEEIYPAALIRKNDTNEPESWDERRIIPGMLALIQEQKKKIDELERRILALEN